MDIISAVTITAIVGFLYLTAMKQNARAHRAERSLEAYRESARADWLANVKIPNALDAVSIDEETGVTPCDIGAVYLDGVRVERPYAYNIAENWVDVLEARDVLGEAERVRRSGAVIVKLGKVDSVEDERRAFTRKMILARARGDEAGIHRALELLNAVEVAK